MTTPSPETSTDISSAFIETLVLIHRNFYRNLATPIPLNQFATLMTLRLDQNEIVRQKFLSSLQEFSEEERAELYHSITDLNHYIEKMGPSHNG